MTKNQAFAWATEEAFLFVDPEGRAIIGAETFAKIGTERFQGIAVDHLPAVSIGHIQMVAARTGQNGKGAALDTIIDSLGAPGDAIDGLAGGEAEGAENRQNTRD